MFEKLTELKHTIECALIISESNGGKDFNEHGQTQANRLHGELITSKCIIEAILAKAMDAILRERQSSQSE